MWDVVYRPRTLTTHTPAHHINIWYHLSSLSNRPVIIAESAITVSHTITKCRRTFNSYQVNTAHTHAHTHTTPHTHTHTTHTHRLFHSCSDAHVLHHAVCVVERLCGSSEEREAVRLGGGIPLLLNILSRNDITDSTDNEGCDKVTYDEVMTTLWRSNSDFR